jgi:N6-adenosine-specific RNA methylase IME4
MQIKKEFKDLIPPLSQEEFKQLEENCLKEGIRDAIVTWQGFIIDGHNRYEIAQRHGLEFRTVEKDFENVLDVRYWMILNQFGRRNLNGYQRSLLALELEDVISEMIKKGKSIKVSNYRQTGEVCQNSDKPDTKKELAKIADVSHDTIMRVKAIEAKAPDEVKEKLRTGEVSINQAYTEIKKEEKKAIVQEKIQSLKEKEVLPATGKYDVIVLDPPWQMEKIEREVAPNQVGFDYPTMTIDEIKAFKLPNENDCHVFMWITQKHHRYGFEIFDAWNVKFICEFVWHKNGGFQPFGLPQFNHEYVMYGRIGTPQFIDFKSFFTCFKADRTGHSAKPDAFYETIKRVTAGKRIDIFNRRKIDGYDTWGNQAV